MKNVALFCIFLFGIVAAAQQPVPVSSNACHMQYPNVAGELLLENEQVVVQRFTIKPGQWEGIHRHPPHQLYIQLTAGDWTYKTVDRSDNFSMAAGDVSWNEFPTELAEQHESRNAGDGAISYLWVGLKPGCLER